MTLRIALTLCFSCCLASSAFAQNIRGTGSRPFLVPIQEPAYLQSDRQQPAAAQDDQIRDAISERVLITKLGDWPARDIREISLDVRQPGLKTPDDQSDLLESYGRKGPIEASPKLFAWTAPNIRYQPLYFEDVALERYGQARGPYVQSALSGVHMFRSAVWLPYHMLIDRPRECDYPLGFCRPGTEPPLTYQRMWWGLRR